MVFATLRLFNAVQIDGGHHKRGFASFLKRPFLRLFKIKNGKQKSAHASVLARTIKNGYILVPAIRPDDALLDAIETVVGISGEKANAAFHKSWSVVRDASMETLVTQQSIHYITTYGFEQ